MLLLFMEHMVGAETRLRKTHPNRKPRVEGMHNVGFVSQNIRQGNRRERGGVEGSSGLQKIRQGDWKRGMWRHPFFPCKLGSQSLNVQKCTPIQAWSAKLASRKLRSAAWRLQELASFSAGLTALENWACLNVCDGFKGIQGFERNVYFYW